ncbi:LysM peptidoglycan-binding domain-containing protein [Siccirubricoccus sp. KC 17139]|uniref:LysM peptidoglycan-binding domain-containing protein n=1 Tax=Siccirubricoccus soli TaxID=2899147 RepID=A0ABT1D8Z3_9PROT|nr:LysM peptidoglycan-binding domain-containing protein [Siccirubricoccus soli]MCO6417450.1 LysM peptidoglycan-binding domain-containing protein [Siccirubricoccus soli]MCP2683585.1 LysM peptidoglycan-binding domain-containing protein [Siccirubricoccus soli]
MPRYLFPAEAGIGPAGALPSTEAVLARFAALGLPHQGISARLKGDCLTLEGEVADGEARERLVLAAGNMPGIAAVDDRLAPRHTPSLLESLGSFARLPAGSASTAAAEETVHAAQPEPGERFGAGGSLFHTVAPGETLEAIAARHYGDARRAVAILEANQPMLSGPDAVRPGVVLRVPER